LLQFVHLFGKVSLEYVMSTYKNTHVTKVCNSEKSGSIPMVKIETRERDILSSAHRRFAFALVGSGIFSEVHG